MLEENKRLVIDLDGVICKEKEGNQDYEDLKPNNEIINQLKKYKENGFYIIIFSSRNMRTFDGNIGKINAVTMKKIHLWLDKHGVPYDEIFVGKPWCGFEGFYVDDRAVRPSEFLALPPNKILDIIKSDKNVQKFNFNS